MSGFHNQDGLGLQQESVVTALGEWASVLTPALELLDGKCSVLVIVCVRSTVSCTWSVISPLGFVEC